MPGSLEFNFAAKPIGGGFPARGVIGPCVGGPSRSWKKCLNLVEF